MSVGGLYVLLIQYMGGCIIVVVVLKLRSFILLFILIKICILSLKIMRMDILL